MTVTADLLYEEDFYAWTQQQAELLRRLPTISNELDIEHIAEEIEDLGRSDLRAAQSLCERSIEAKLDLPARYRMAVRLARRLERDVPGFLNRLPAECPYAIKQIISSGDEDWFPSPR